MTTSAIHPDSAVVVAALPLRPRPGLYIDPALDRDGCFVVLEAAESAGDSDAGDAIIGLAVPQGDSYYLGCITCHGGIEEAEGGMCPPCREDLAFVSAVSGGPA